MKTVSIRAVEGRINRKLAHEGQQLRKTRAGSNDRAALGEYYIVDIRTNRLECDDVCLGDVGHHYDVLAKNERVEGAV